jgi:hypothetical protein
MRRSLPIQAAHRLYGAVEGVFWLAMEITEFVMPNA